MKYYAVMMSLGLLCIACARSGALPSDSLDCETGTLVRLMASDNCVFDLLNVPDLCPVGVPFQYDLSAHRICSSDPVLSRRATVAIRDEAIREQSGEAAILDTEVPPAMETPFVMDPPTMMDTTPVMEAPPEFDSPVFDSEDVDTAGAMATPITSD